MSASSPPDEVLLHALDAAVRNGPAGAGAARGWQCRVNSGGRVRMSGTAHRARCSLARRRRPRSPATRLAPAWLSRTFGFAHHGLRAPRRERRFPATSQSQACAQRHAAVGRKLARRHLRPGVYFLRVGLDTSRRRATEASAPLERTPTSNRGVAGQLPRPARRSKKWPVRRGLRGRAARGGVFMPVLAAL